MRGPAGPRAGPGETSDRIEGWVAFGVAFWALVRRGRGTEFGQQYFAGYLIEKSLAVHNLFVWAILFSYFAVPREYQHRVLFLGVLGALVLRGVFSAGSSSSPGRC